MTRTLNRPCTQCDRPAQHTTFGHNGRTNLCCYHWIQAGHPPSDWHSDCALAAWTRTGT